MRVEVAVGTEGNARAAVRTSGQSSKPDENKVVSLRVQVERNDARHCVGTVTDAER